MSIGFGRTDPQAHPRRPDARAGAAARPLAGTSAALLVAALGAGGAVGYLFAERPAPAAAPRVAGPAAELAAVRQQLDEARMALRLADARSQELERQIDALNQKLTESQDQLTFFKKAREGKR